MRQVVDWIEYHRRFWQTRFDSLEKYLGELTPETDGNANHNETSDDPDQSG